ncbi:MAG TPA: signal peptidase I [Acidimicrobiales bacterium]|nr:signal peptidase I [Acidimicrobiales bacterium]
MDPSPPPAAPPAELPPSPPVHEAEPPQRSSVRSAVEWVVIVVAALLAALLIKTFLLQAFYIPSDSMNPTLVQRDRVLVNKLSYHFHDVHRGDIVVFKRPPGENDPQIKDLIKRVIGLPGDTIEGRDGQILINGRVLHEPYTAKNSPMSDFSSRTVPAGHYFVMGDNRGNSKDSRVFGPIAKSLIVGRAFIRVWPLSRITLL